MDRRTVKTKKFYREYQICLPEGGGEEAMVVLKWYSSGSLQLDANKPNNLLSDTSHSILFAVISNELVRLSSASE